MRFRLHSTPWLSGHERRCTDHEFPSWMKDPENQTERYSSLQQQIKPVKHFIREKLYKALGKRRRTYRHRAFVSCKFIQMFTRFSLPNHYQIVHVSCGLKRFEDVTVTFNVAILQQRCDIDISITKSGINRKQKTFSHQIFPIWWYGHTQDVSCVSNMAVFCTFSSTMYCMELLPIFNIPWRYHLARFINRFTAQFSSV